MRAMGRKSRAAQAATTSDIVTAHPWRYLAAWREDAKLSQDEAGERLGVSGVTIHRYENGKTPLTLNTWFLLAEIYKAGHPGQLLFPPSMKSRSAALEQAWGVIAALPSEQLSRWIGMGQDLRAAVEAPRPLLPRTDDAAD